MAEGRSRSNQNCPIKNSAAMCRDCARAIRVLDDDAIAELQKQGEKNPWDYAYDCPDRLMVLYMGEVRDAMSAIADQLAAIADALEGDGGRLEKRKKAPRKKAKRSDEGGDD